MVPAGSRWLPVGRGGVRCGPDIGFPRRGCGGWSGCKNAFDQRLFPRVPLRYALPGRSRGLYRRRTNSLPCSRRDRCPHRPIASASARYSQRQRKEKKVDETLTPTRPAPSATGRQSRESQKGIACPKARQNRSRQRYAGPWRAEGCRTGARPGAFFSSTGRGFRRRRKRSMADFSATQWGRILPWKPPCGS